MRIVFMGTPDFSVPTLAALKEAGHEIALVVTQPDRPAGRGKSLRACPVKAWAEEQGLPVFCPERIRRPEALEVIRAVDAEIGVVVAFGQILPQALLDMMPFGCVNVHASLLPKYRGAAPIQFSILEGEAYTGVTTMQMGPGLDDGPILLQKQVAIAADETGESLFEKLSAEGASLCVETLAGLQEGTIVPRIQDETQATKVGLITKEMGRLDFSKPAIVLERQIRGLYPWPGSFTYENGRLLKVMSATVRPEDPAAEPIETPSAACGAVVRAADAIEVQTADGVLCILEVQPEGKRRMTASEYLRGHRIPEGTVLG